MQILTHANAQWCVLKPAGLDPDVKYHLEGRGMKFDLRDFGGLVNYVAPIHVKQDVKQMFKALLGNDQAMTIVITIVLFNTATYITSNLLIYFFKYDLAGSNWQGNYTLFNTFAGAMQILAMMILFPLLRKAFDTMKIFYIGVLSAVLGYIVLLVLSIAGAKSVYLFFIPGFFIMGAVGILNVICTIYLCL